MKLLVVGGGGREHAIIKKLKENPSVETIYALPGNGGIAADAVCVPIGATDIPRIVEFATQNKIDYAVVAPDDPDEPEPPPMPDEPPDVCACTWTAKPAAKRNTRVLTFMGSHLAGCGRTDRLACRRSIHGTR